MGVRLRGFERGRVSRKGETPDGDARAANGDAFMRGDMPGVRIVRFVSFTVQLELAVDSSFREAVSSTAELLLAPGIGMLLLMICFFLFWCQSQLIVQLSFLFLQFPIKNKNFGKPLALVKSNCCWETCNRMKGSRLRKLW
jgi:hypothetical protein